MTKPFVIFDLDGTLIDSSQDIVNGINDARAELGLEERPYEQILAGVGDGARKLVERVFAEQPDLIEQAYQLFIKHYSEKCTVHTRPFEPVPAVVEALNKADYPLAIVSNKPEKLVHKIANHLGWNRQFLALIGGDSTPHRKPDPAPLRFACENAGISERPTIMVGDGPQDILAGKAIGAKTVFVSWGWHKNLTGCECDYQAKNAEEFFNFPSLEFT